MCRDSLVIWINYLMFSWIRQFRSLRIVHLIPVKIFVHLILKHLNLLSRMCFLIYPLCNNDLDCRLLPAEFKYAPNCVGQHNELVYHYEKFHPCHHREQSGGKGLKKVYNCPFSDCKCIRMEPCSERLSQKDYCEQLAKLRGVTPLLLSVDGQTPEGHWGAECVQFSAAYPSKPVCTNGQLAAEWQQTLLCGMEWMSPSAWAHCQKIQDNLQELYSTRHLLQKHTSEADTTETSRVLQYHAKIERCECFLSITESEPLSPRSKRTRWSSGHSS